MPVHTLHSLTNTRHPSLPAKLASTNTRLFNFCLKCKASIRTREPSSARKRRSHPRRNGLTSSLTGGPGPLPQWKPQNQKPGPGPGSGAAREAVRRPWYRVQARDQLWAQGFMAQTLTELLPAPAQTPNSDHSPVTPAPTAPFTPEPMAPSPLNLRPRHPCSDGHVTPAPKAPITLEPTTPRPRIPSPASVPSRQGHSSVSVGTRGGGTLTASDGPGGLGPPANDGTARCEELGNHPADG